VSIPLRARRGLRALTAAAGLGLVAAPLALITPAAHAAGPVEVNILGINDFHGRIKSNGVEAGAAVLAGAVDQIRTAHPNTVFAAAGDLIGASTFESFIAHDKPTIDALNASGLEVSSVGNHEFDQGYGDLVNRVMAPYDATTNPYGGATWKYIGANVRMKSNNSPALDPTFVKDFGDVEVGFIGAVTEHLPELVSPGGISDIKVTDIPTEVNAEADALKADGVDLIVLLVHEGAPSTDCATMDDDPTSDFGSIITGVDDNVDAIVSGHTHLSYNCSFPVAGWAGRPVTDRPVVSAGQYGYNLNQLTYQVDPATGHPTSIAASILPLTTTSGSPAVTTPNYPADPEVKSIVDAAVAQSDVLGAQPLGDIAGPFKRASRPKADQTGFEENRGGESTLGNLVAEAQRWATSSETTGSAQIAFMNPGGLRADMVGNNAGGYPAVLTYKQAATVQPFANTLVNMDLTGAQIQATLEQQWQPAGASRPFLRLGTSNGFRYTYDPTAAAGERITGMWLNGRPIEAAQTYSVTVNSFLSTGGDNFTTLASGTNKKDTGKTDLQGMVDFMAEFGDSAPLAVDSRQHAVGVDFPDGAPAEYGLGDTVAFDLSSLAMTGADDVQDTSVTVTSGGVDLGSFDVDNTVAPGNTNDEPGKASVSFVVPEGVTRGAQSLRITGNNTGTVVTVPVVFDVPKAEPTLTATAAPDHIVVKQTKPRIKITVMVGDQPATGPVKVFLNGETYAGSLVNGKATVKLPAFGTTGKKTVRVKYYGNDTTKQASTTVSFRVHAS
jgi:5'-nucleotidase